MEIIRKTEIIVETNRRFTVEQTEFTEKILCRECAALMLKAEHITILFGISCRAVYRLIEEAAVDFTETENGASFVCPNSLADYFDEQEKNKL